MKHIYLGEIPKHSPHRKAVMRFRQDGSPYVSRPFAKCDCISLIGVVRRNGTAILAVLGAVGLLIAGIALSVRDAAAR